jgi:hypothetical protein
LFQPSRSSPKLTLPSRLTAAPERTRHISRWSHLESPTAMRTAEAHDFIAHSIHEKRVCCDGWITPSLWSKSLRTGGTCILPTRRVPDWLVPCVGSDLSTPQFCQGQEHFSSANPALPKNAPQHLMIPKSQSDKRKTISPIAPESAERIHVANSKLNLPPESCDPSVANMCLRHS